MSDLDIINSAISAIENGAQEYKIGSRMLKRGDLKTLYAERRLLKAEQAQADGNSTFVARFEGR